MTEQRTNERGNHVTSQYRGPCTQRYAYDFRLCTPTDGWQSYDTYQSSCYFGVWVHENRREIVIFAEGDEIRVSCPSPENLRAELTYVTDFYGPQHRLAKNPHEKTAQDAAPPLDDRASRFLDSLLAEMRRENVQELFLSPGYFPSSIEKNGPGRYRVMIWPRKRNGHVSLSELSLAHQDSAWFPIKAHQDGHDFRITTGEIGPAIRHPHVAYMDLRIVAHYIVMIAENGQRSGRPYY